MTARDATILSMIKAVPATRWFDRLVSKLDDPRLAERAAFMRRKNRCMLGTSPKTDRRIA